MEAPPTTNVLGVEVSAMTMADTVGLLVSWRQERRGGYVAVTNVHAIMECQDDPTLARIYREADLVTADGMPLVWLHWLEGKRHAQRVYGPDLMLALCERSVKEGLKHYFYGGAPGVADDLAETLVARFPGLAIAGTRSPPFRALTEEEDAADCEAIIASDADFVWVGLGAPKQERWMAAHRDRLRDQILLGVGAAFDFHTGRKPQAPKWMRGAGLEWAFRLGTEPRRLARRYLLHNPRFVWRVAKRRLTNGT
jgi:N-acetylglucosaminyldiphosphoundecaprenol N-acetyl-beta-D-mannosaminyltransferase